MATALSNGAGYPSDGVGTGIGSGKGLSAVGAGPGVGVADSTVSTLCGVGTGTGCGRGAPAPRTLAGVAVGEPWPSICGPAAKGLETLAVDGAALADSPVKGIVTNGRAKMAINDAMIEITVSKAIGRGRCL